MVFGIYRAILALAVVLSHLGGVREIGKYAVFGFYILSGFLMTLILHESYGYSAKGIRKYALNRFLRIYPAYWLVALVTLILLYVFPSQISDFHERLRCPKTWQSWALTVELFWYAAMAVGVSKTRKSTWIWWVLALLHTLVINILRLDWDWRYFSIAPAALPFATGALLYHYKTRCRPWSGGAGPSCCCWFLLRNSVSTSCFTLTAPPSWRAP